MAIGRALLTQPRLLLLDEPLASLDAARREELLPYLETLRDRLAIPMVYVSHQFDEVLRLATHLVLMDARPRWSRRAASAEMSLRSGAARDRRPRSGRRDRRRRGARPSIRPADLTRVRVGAGELRVSRRGAQRRRAAARADPGARRDRRDPQLPRL